MLLHNIFLSLELAWKIIIIYAPNQKTNNTVYQQVL